MRWAGTTQVRGRIRHGNLQKAALAGRRPKGPPEHPRRRSKVQWNHAVAAAALARFLGGEHDGAPPMQQAPPCAKQARTYPRKRNHRIPCTPPPHTPPPFPCRGDDCWSMLYMQDCIHLPFFFWCPHLSSHPLLAASI